MSTRMKFFLSAAFIGTLTMVPGIKPAHAQSDSVYQEFGGKPGIKAVVNSFVGYVGADPRINGYFAHAHMAHLIYELNQQFCALTNGPCTYTGKDMKTAHVGMQITQAAFNALDEDLNKAMDDNKIPIDAQNYLTGKLAPMEQPVVTKD